MRGTTLVLLFALSACHDRALDAPDAGSRDDAGASGGHDAAASGSGEQDAHSGSGGHDAHSGSGGHDAAASGSSGHDAHAGADAATGGSGGQSADAGKVPDTVECSGTGDVQATHVVPTILLLIDGSMSMDQNYGGATDPTRWQAVRQALLDPSTGVVYQLQSVVKFGLAVFATTPSCPLPLGVVDPGLSNGQSIDEGMPLSSPGTFTPTGLALDQVVDVLPAPSPQQSAPQIVVLVTDGDPSACADETPNYAPAIAAAVKLQQKSLRMHVIGIGDDVSKADLQVMANLGAGLKQDASPGATVYYPADPAALTDTLRTLIKSELSCELELSGKGVMPGSECRGLVTLNGNALQCNGPDGWVLEDARHIELQGAACEMLRNASDVFVQAQFPCDVLQK
jgi:hypothetical protein